MKQFLFFFLLLNWTLSWGQLTSSEVKRLTYHVNNQINKLRVAHNLPALKLNDTLSEAANFHSQYMVQNSILSHQQKETKFKDPTDRVNHYGGKSFSSVGENILHTRTLTLPLSEDGIIILAKEITLQWKNSPPHYKNIINGTYTHSGLGFSINKNNIIYATQVFAKKGYTVKNQLSENAFNLQMGTGNCDVKFKDYLNIVHQYPHFIKRVGNELFIHISDKNIFGKVISGKFDGIAIDLVKKEQFTCGLENKLDASPIYDGILLKPVYRAELFEGNRAIGDIRLITKVGEIPPQLANEQFNYSIVLIKDGKVCKYLHSSSVEVRMLDLQPFNPILKDEKLNYKLKDFVLSEYVPFQFDVNKTIPNHPLHLLKKFPIVNASIHAFSSVEGDSLKNVNLQVQRAQYIQNYLYQHSSKTFPIQVEVKENWDLFLYQLEAYDLFSLLDDSSSYTQVRQVVNEYAQETIWKKMLNEQRLSYAIVDYQVDFESYSDLPVEILNLRDALSSNNTKQFNKALYDMYYKLPDYAHIVLEPQMMNFAYQHPEVVQNFMAVLSRVYHHDVLQSGRLVNHWLKNATSIDGVAIDNTLHVYTLISDKLIHSWDVDRYTISLVCPPKIVKPLMQNSANNELKLNVHINLLHYFSHTGNYEGLDESYDYIHNHFYSRLKTADDYYNLARFSDLYSMIDHATKVLKEGYEKGQLDKRGVLHLCQNLVFFQDGLDTDFFKKVVDECVQSNTKNWCYWLKHNIQNLRYPYLKERYCTVCN